MDVVKFNEAEVAEPDDFTNIGLNARASEDALVAGAIDYPTHWADFTVSNPNALELIVSPGTLFSEGKLYRNAAQTTINIQQYLPIVAGDNRFLALLADGAVETTTEERLFETDAETEATIAQQAPKVEKRKIDFTVAFGAPSPTPLKPAIPANRCCIAWVELSTVGVAAIEPNHAARVKTLYEHEGRLVSVEGEIGQISASVRTIKTDIANIQARLGDIPSPAIVRQMKRSIAQLLVGSSVPPEALAYDYDPGLVGDKWDHVHASWLARVHEGVRFPFAAERDMQLALIDDEASNIRKSGNLLLPEWTEETRLEVAGDGGSVNIAGAVHTVVDAIQKTLSRSVTEYGPTVTTCENVAEWANYSIGKNVGEIFSYGGEDFEIIAAAPSGHGIYRWISVRKIITRQIIETYWEYVTSTVGLNGSIHGQQWLNTQPSVLTSVDLNFTLKAASGPVHLLICECFEHGAPNFSAVIARVEKQPEDLVLGWNKFALAPTLLDGGKRYAWVTVTTGNHALATVSGNAFAQGSRFVCSDGVWAQPLTDSDFAFRLNCAKFARTRTTVDFQPLTLDGGMTEIRLLHAGWEAAGTKLAWEIKVPSIPNAQWRPLTLDNADGADDLNGLPALVQLRAVFMGTTDLQPALVLDAYARGMTFRNRGDFVAISAVINFGVATTTVQTDSVIDAFEPVKHTAAPKLVIGATIYTPSVTTITDEDSDNGMRRRILATFTVPSTTTARYRLDMTTTEVTDIPFLQNRAVYAL
ncbi:MAG: hypothetical protein FD139_702 [Methylocystaceae bacterium]|nr:MAG: hypothetical protein FD148_19 [Methylocystaceae bacterium]KAF0213952.1 MAG: hypothetical protein FD172_76 [Methylocystaceae bacterium]TXT46857.1 MAG: hypothetical protein FD139_702 [Methylocystaceae bacterium]